MYGDSQHYIMHVFNKKNCGCALQKEDVQLSTKQMTVALLKDALEAYKDAMDSGKSRYARDDIFANELATVFEEIAIKQVCTVK